MIQTFISRRHTDDLILLFAGWGVDTHPFACLSHIGCDCCVCYDYTDLNFDTTPFLDYKTSKSMRGRLAFGRRQRSYPIKDCP